MLGRHSRCWRHSFVAGEADEVEHKCLHIRRPMAWLAGVMVQYKAGLDNNARVHATTSGDESSTTGSVKRGE